MSKEIILTDFNFEDEVIRSDKPVLVDFWAPWCGPCRMLSPIIEQIADEYSDKIKIGKCNVDENQNIAFKYNISSIPTLIVFNKGKIFKQTVGVRPKQDIIDLFKSLI